MSGDAVVLSRRAATGPSSTSRPTPGVTSPRAYRAHRKGAFANPSLHPDPSHLHRWRGSTRASSHADVRSRPQTTGVGAPEAPGRTAARPRRTSRGGRPPRLLPRSASTELATFLAARSVARAAKRRATTGVGGPGGRGVTSTSPTRSPGLAARRSRSGMANLRDASASRTRTRTMPGCASATRPSTTRWAGSADYNLMSTIPACTCSARRILRTMAPTGWVRARSCRGS